MNQEQKQTIKRLVTQIDAASRYRGYIYGREKNSGSEEFKNQRAKCINKIKDLYNYLDSIVED